MKKTVLLIIPLLFLFVGCASLYNRSNYNNYKPILLKNIEIDNLLNKKWLLKYYIIDEKVFPIEEERQNDYYIFKSNNQKEEIFYGKSIIGSWEFLPHGNFIMFYSDDMKLIDLPDRFCHTSSIMMHKKNVKYFLKMRRRRRSKQLELLASEKRHRLY